MDGWRNSGKRSFLRVHLLEMVVVVCFWRADEREVVAGVADHGYRLCHDHPHRSREEVGSHYDWAGDDGQGVRQKVLDGVTIHRCQTDGRGPLVVYLVDSLVEWRVVQQPKTEK